MEEINLELYNGIWSLDGKPRPHMDNDDIYSKILREEPEKGQCLDVYS